MNIRKSLNKVFLSAATFFWASCGSDSSTTPETPENGTEPSSQSMAPLESSSSEALSSQGDIQSSSSESAPVESSSSAEPALSSSSYSQYPYKLASDTTVSCNYTYGPTNNCISYASSGKKEGPDARTLENQLEYNKTRTLEELEAIEDTLELTPYMKKPFTAFPPAFSTKSIPVTLAQTIKAALQNNITSAKTTWSISGKSKAPAAPNRQAAHKHRLPRRFAKRHISSKVKACDTTSLTKS